MALPAKRRDYSEQERELGLIALAYANGNGRKASRELKAAGVTIPRPTLESWRKSQLDRYESIRSEVMPKIREEMAEKHRAIAEEATDLAGEAVTQLRARLKSG